MHDRPPGPRYKLLRSASAHGENFIATDDPNTRRSLTSLARSHDGHNKRSPLRQWRRRRRSTVRWAGRILRVPSIARAGSRRRIQWRSQAWWQGVYVPSAALKPVPQSFCIRRAIDGADPSRWAEGRSVCGAGLQQHHGARPVGACRAGELSQKARRGHQHAVLAASDALTKFLQDG
jgi:hypothetical protein